MRLMIIPKYLLVKDTYVKYYVLPTGRSSFYDNPSKRLDECKRLLTKNKRKPIK